MGEELRSCNEPSDLPARTTVVWQPNAKIRHWKVQWCMRLQPDKVLMDMQDDTAVEVMQLLSLDLSTTSLAVNVVDQVGWMICL